MAQKKKLKKEITEAFEPEISYQNKINEIITFSSFEEMNEYDIKIMAETTPEQRFQNILALINYLFAQELKKPSSELTIQFK